MAFYFKESIEGTIELLREQKKEAEREEIVSVILLVHFERKFQLMIFMSRKSF